VGAESTGDVVVQWFSILTAMFFLSVASLGDWQRREVSDKVWLSFAPIGGFLTAYALLLSPENLVASAVSVTATTIIALLLYYVGVYGGADAKALICLAIALPIVPQKAPLIGHVHPIFPLAVLYNSYLLAFFSSIALLAYNVYQCAARKGSLFPALEYESPTRKFLAMLTGYRVEFGKLESSIHLYPMEEPTQSESKERKLRLLVSADADREELVRRLKTSMQAQDGKVWATPGLPLLIFMTAGFLLVVFVGDLLMWLVFSFFNSL
jgi:preflagellin peptidase FlaK